MRNTSKRIVAASVAICAAVTCTAVASAQPGRPGGPIAGTLLSERPLHTAAALPGAAATTAITYASTGAQGGPIVVSGTVSVPRTPPPPGGWPTISWAHGTTGYADPCAPSRDTSDGLSHDYLGAITQTLDTWVRRGYAVVQTDYEGLGTPGGHPYINGPSEANTVADIVRAAQRVNPHIGRNWVAMGHSQGGQAALFAAQQADSRQPSLSLKAAIALAPGGVGLSQTVEYVKSGQPGAEAAQAFLPLIVLGAQAARPSIDPAKIFTPAMDPLLQVARTKCLTQMRSVATVPSSDFSAPMPTSARSPPISTRRIRGAPPRVYRC